MLQSLRFKAINGVRAFRSWGIPYLRSRLHPGQFRPVLCYLFVDWRCNYDCHYCFQYNNQGQYMEPDTAFRAVDWLHSLGCRVLPLMGGEPLVRKGFTLELIRYAAEKGFFVYLPTNGKLMDRQFINEMGKAGVAAVNLAVDCLEPKTGLPKALSRIEEQFHLLVEAAKRYCFLLFFNINVCRNNISDAYQLTQIARQYRIGTDYHLNEAPHEFVDVSHYGHQDDGLHITPEQYEEIDALADWLVARQAEGWPMVNPPEHLLEFKRRSRGSIPPWNCLAGINGALIRTDGSLAPCFDLITNHDYQWGHIEEPDFDPARLVEVKKRCQPKCSSTCFYTMSTYYTNPGMRTWMKKHMQVG